LFAPGAANGAVIPHGWAAVQSRAILAGESNSIGKSSREKTMAEQRPVLEDPLHVNEVFASEVTGVGLVHSNVAITFANVRFDEGIGNQPSRPHRIVVNRLVLTKQAASQLVESLQKLALDAATLKADTLYKN
jgi:hypothetical protein